ncbi:MAG: COX15/CtaA family protein [Gammaproteobacteria bacterium]|nr:COX15/CtaA family protein [Gammaproteobacteria bacterium]
MSEQSSHDRQVASWLLLCAAVIFGMILLGGVTRLTHSGLSMVEWKPLMGVIPPLSEQAWQETFEKYRQFPEYQKINRGMSLEGFKSIFMYEYLHRVLGRLIGVIFLLPMLYFAVRQRVRPGLMPKLVVLFFMGGLQGLLGWYMVKSGLVDNPRVSQYRLTAHLGVAVAIYAYMLWLAFDLLFAPQGRHEASTPPFTRWSLSMVALVYVMILSGGLVAGTRAGFAYPTWPMMGDTFIPMGLYATSPAWLAMFEDVTTIQFNHRMFAYLLFVLINVFAFLVYRRVHDGRVRLGVVLLVLALLLQVTLGISTLLLHVPIALAAAHQGGAVLLLSAALFSSHALVQARAASPLSGGV